MEAVLYFHLTTRNRLSKQINSMETVAEMCVESFSNRMKGCLLSLMRIHVAMQALQPSVFHLRFQNIGTGTTIVKAFQCRTVGSAGCL